MKSNLPVLVTASIIITSFLYPCQSAYREKNTIVQENHGGIKWYDANSFIILGRGWTSLKHEYDRLPDYAEPKVRPAVWKLSTNSAGLAVYFSSNSTSIHVRWNLRYNNNMPHMAETGIKGLDLYAWNEGRWQFVNNGRPSGELQNEAELISGMKSGTREYLLYLPLYDGIDSLFIGTDSDADITTPNPSRFSGKPVVFYGTSITQGGCATRPGMAYTSIIGRRLNLNIINLGFSGNGRMEQELAELISEIDASCYILDCLPNLNAEQVSLRTIPFVEFLKNNHPEAHIILVESALPQEAYFNEAIRQRVEEKNYALFTCFEQLESKGVKDLYYIKQERLLGYDHEATVDGVHYTDLGFMRYANRLIPYLEGILE